jgi:hypothetical protein
VTRTPPCCDESWGGSPQLCLPVCFQCLLQTMGTNQPLPTVKAGDTCLKMSPGACVLPLQEEGGDLSQYGGVVVVIGGRREEKVVSATVGSHETGLQDPCVRSIKTKAGGR